MLQKTIALALTILCSGSLLAQGNANPGVDHSYKPMMMKLDEKGTKFIRLITWHQMWITHTSNNPGTLDVNGEPQKSATDMSIRRSRFLIQAQISPRFMIISHWGINNQSFINGGSAGSLGTGASATGQGGGNVRNYIFTMPGQSLP